MPKSRARADKHSKQAGGRAAQNRGGESASRLRDVLGIVLITFAVMGALALISYSPLDFPKANRTGSEISNLLGTFGAHIAFYQSEIFGRYFSLILPLFLFYFGLDLLRNKRLPLLRRQFIPLTTLAVLSVSIWSWVRMALHMSDSDQLTGVAGIVLQQLLTSYLGKAGGAILLAALALIYLTLVLRLNWSRLLHAVAAAFAAIAGLVRLPERTSETKLPPKKQDRTPPPPDKSRPDTDEDDNDPEWSEFKTGVPEIVRNAPPPPAPPDRRRQNGPQPKPEDYLLPGPELLSEPEIIPDVECDESTLRKRARELEERLSDYGVSASVVAIHPGPVITRYDLKPSKGVKVSKISNLADDLALSLSAVAIRIIAPIPGAGAVGIEVPNERIQIVYLREIIQSEIWRESNKPLSIALGKTAQGEELVVDLSRMPHLLIAGTTGSGKSVCINTIIASMLMRNRPDEVQFVMIDPKKIELSAYAELRRHHLLYLDALNEVIATEPKNAVALLQSVVLEMERRYDLLAETGARNLKEYNKIVNDRQALATENGGDENGNGNVRQVPLPNIVVIIDELADLMMVAAHEVEEPIARLAQMSRAVGIHLIVATQRPSVDVITGVIKANFPARIAFMVASKIDSRTILDRSGAEKLLGSGDGLLMSSASPTPIRFHGAFISTEDMHKLIGHVRGQPTFVKQVELRSPEEDGGVDSDGLSGERDPLFDEAVRIVARHQQGSVSLLQRRLKIGYSRAGRLLDQLEMAGVVGPFEGSKAREVYFSPEQAESYLAGSDEASR